MIQKLRISKQDAIAAVNAALNVGHTTPLAARVLSGVTTTPEGRPVDVDTLLRSCVDHWGKLAKEAKVCITLCTPPLPGAPPMRMQGAFHCCSCSLHHAHAVFLEFGRCCSTSHPHQMACVFTNSAVLFHPLRSLSNRLKCRSPCVHKRRGCSSQNLRLSWRLPTPRWLQSRYECRTPPPTPPAIHYCRK